MLEGLKFSGDQISESDCALKVYGIRVIELHTIREYQLNVLAEMLLVFVFMGTNFLVNCANVHWLLDDCVVIGHLFR